MKEPTKIAARQAREERLRAALRENLKRRKAQLRGRDGDARDGSLPERDPEQERTGGREKDGS